MAKGEKMELSKYVAKELEKQGIEVEIEKSGKIKIMKEKDVGKAQTAVKNMFLGK
jgi:menaquinone-dependent protoporphyrinogen IX oxidase